MTQRSIADDVVFVPLCGEHAGWAVSSDGLPRVPPGLDAAVAGAYLLELALAHSLERQGDQVIATHRHPPADPDLATVLRQIASERPRSVGWWIGRLAASRPHLKQLQRLRARGLVSEYDQLAWGWFGKRTVKRCFAPDWDAEAEVMRKLHAALSGEVSDDRTVGLLTLLCAADLHRWFTNYDPEGRRRAERAVESHWIGREVAHLILSQAIGAPI